jgi:hypothetical protein
VGDFTVVHVTRATLAAVVGDEPWMVSHIDQGEALATNQARCVLVRDAGGPPTVIVLGARSGRSGRSEPASS